MASSSTPPPPDDTTEAHSSHSPAHPATEPATAVNTPRASFSYFTPKRKLSSSPSSSHDDNETVRTPPSKQVDEDEKARAQAATRGEADHGHGHTQHVSSESPSVIVVGFEGDDDPLDPHNEPFWKKMCCTLTIAVNAFLISCFASAYLFVSPDIEESLGASRELVIVGFVTYVIMWGPGPLLWAPLSSSIGRKPVYIGAVALWTIFNIGCARAQSIGTLIGCRLLAGFFGSGCLCNGGGSNTDMFHGRSRIKATTQYSFVVFLGPVFGPLIGGAVQQYAPKSADGGWRWVFYAGIAAGTVVTILHCLVIETNHNVRLRKRVKQLQKAQREQQSADGSSKGMEEGGVAGPAVRYTTEADEHGLTISKQVLQVSGSAARMIVEEPIILFISLWQTTVMAVLYLFFEAYPVVFGQGHGFDSFQTGLTFFGVGCGMTAACIWGVTGELRLWERRVEKAGGEAKPEMRVPQGLAGAIFTVVGLFWFGYTSYPSIHWIVPILGSAVYGIGAISVMLATFSFLVDTFLYRAAPAFAAVGLIRSVVTAVLPLCGTQMFENLNPRNASLILALLACVQVATPLLAIRYGEKLRSKSRFALKTT